MQPYIPGTQVKIHKPCLDCIDGTVELPGDDRDFVHKYMPVKLYHKGYCPTCHGQLWIDEWISIEDLVRWLQELI